MQNSDAVFKQDQSASEHKTNVDYKKYNFRANVDANLTKSTIFSLNLESVIISRNSPGYGDNNDALWSSQAYLPPTIVPVKYSDGKLPSFGRNGNEISPYVLLNHTGYKTYEEQATTLIAKLKQELNMITEGLSVTGLFSMKYNGYYDQYRRKVPDLYLAKGRDVKGALKFDHTFDKQDMSYSDFRQIYRQYYFEFTADYNRVFNKLHRVTGLLHTYRQEVKESNIYDPNKDDFTLDERIRAIPKRYQAISGRATYSYNDTYLIEANVGYTGSENFKKGFRYGVFPAIAVGWIPTQYDFVKNNLPILNYLKLRASAGKVGNDRINKVRFPYLSLISSGGGNTTWGGPTLGEVRVGADNLEWETTTKYDLGLDAHLLDSKIDLTVDFYKNQTRGIFQARKNMPEEAGFVTDPFTNIGSMDSWGMDGNISYTQTLKKDMTLTLRANMTYAKNEVKYWEQSNVRYPYQSYTGVPYGVQRGLISLGLFKDENDIMSSPVQTYSSDVRPGDIKYKDVNGDGKIDDDDVVPLSYSNVPQIQYGFAAQFKWKNFSASAFIEGVSKVQYFYGGSGYYPFSDGSRGNVLDIVYDKNNRWTPESYSGTKDTENPNARFPRLTYGENKNNNRASTFWLANGEYMRLKNVEVAYMFNTSWMKKMGLNSATLSVIGDNLHVWDTVKLWDPGQASENGAKYPIQRRFTFQLYLTF